MEVYCTFTVRWLWYIWYWILCRERNRHLKHLYRINVASVECFQGYNGIYRDMVFPLGYNHVHQPDILEARISHHPKADTWPFSLFPLHRMAVRNFPNGTATADWLCGYPEWVSWTSESIGGKASNEPVTLKMALPWFYRDFKGTLWYHHSQPPPWFRLSRSISLSPNN